MRTAVLNAQTTTPRFGATVEESDPFNELLQQPKSIEMDAELRALVDRFKQAVEAAGNDGITITLDASSNNCQMNANIQSTYTKSNEWVTVQAKNYWKSYFDGNPTWASDATLYNKMRELLNNTYDKVDALWRITNTGPYNPNNAPSNEDDGLVPSRLYEVSSDKQEAPLIERLWQGIKKLFVESDNF